ncbi:GNAT family N-acetyltransferase [Microbacterium betulae]|uniref:GNAT family N-acetyltransferase n=1 Tax=Microbacterium betulae TaxID=2981139 RepID=A0AA97FE63_9MICO|nr:GNAT family N-acetyltransferase [Microbacterium sp. AB]WOF21488.1 GNAT family N-acetyltransferase [Microbacterium sp. AB]
MELQTLDAAGWRVWRALRLRALTEDPDAFGSRLASWTGDGDREDRWRATFAIPGSVHLVARVHGEPCGMVRGIWADHVDAIELVSLWVAPDVRGRGVATALIDAIEQWAAERAGVLLLSVAPANVRAIRLYESLGFAASRWTGDLLPDGVTREIVMAKSLGDASARPPRRGRRRDGE